MKISLITSLVAPFLMSATAFSQNSGWLTNYSMAFNLAKTENKAVLMEFTGSDWSAGCIQVDKDVLSKPAFKEYAAKNLILMLVDFPEHKPQSEFLVAQNRRLQKRYQVSSYPTFFVLGSSGPVLGERIEFLGGGPDAFLAGLRKELMREVPRLARGDYIDWIFNKRVDVFTSPGEVIPNW